MVKKTKNQMTAVADLIVEYKRGDINLEDTIKRYIFLTGLSRHIAETFILNFDRTNIIAISTREKDT